MTETDALDAEATEIARLRAENDELRRNLSGEKRERSRRARSIGAWVMAVLAVLALSAALLLTWTFRTLSNTDLFVDRVGSIIESPDVATVIGDAAAAELVDELELERIVADALPEEVSIAAGPITNAAQGYLAQGVTALVQTDAFQAAWDASLAAGHRVTIGVLTGSDTDAVQNTDGVIVLNLTPVINALVAEGAGFLSELLDRDVSAPELTGEDIDAAVAALEEQLGTDLPSDFGQVVLFESQNLAAAQRAYAVAQTSAWLAPLAGLILALIALAIAPSRLRVGLGIVVGVGLTMLVVAIAVQPLQSSVIEAAAAEGLDNAVAAGFSTVLSSLERGIVVIVLLGVLAAAGLFLAGQSDRAAQGRELLQRSPSLAAEHRTAFLVGGLVAAVGIAALIPGRGWGQLLVVGVLYAGYALAVLLAPRTAVDP